MELQSTQILIIGGGAAGYTAAIYAARAGLSPLLCEGPQPGGQLVTTTEVENFPGYPAGVLGPRMMTEFREQALRFGTDIRPHIVKSLCVESYPYKAHLDNQQSVEAAAIIICTGASPKWLGLANEKRLSGRGVSTCAVCDGFFFRGKTVAIVGGGDSAAEEAISLSRLCVAVHIIIRKHHMRASHIMQQRLHALTNVQLHFNREVVDVLGEDVVSGLLIKSTQDESTEQLAVQGLFLAIGHQPNTWMLPTAIKLDELGYIYTQGKSTATSVPGIFAAGDVQDHRYRQAITAAGTGCMAALDAERFLVTWRTSS